MIFTEYALRKRRIELSREIAEFLEDVDPYGFRDQIGNDETFDDAMERLAHEVYSDIEAGDFDTLFEGVDFREELDGDMLARNIAIIDRLKELQNGLVWNGRSGRMERRSWVLCCDPSDCPMEFCGTEEEMESAGRRLLDRLRAKGVLKLNVWTWYSWRKNGQPYCEITDSGMRILGPGKGAPV